MNESSWLSNCSALLKDKSSLKGISWRQFIIESCNIIDAANNESVPVEVKFAVCYISSFIISHCGDDDSAFPGTFNFMDKLSNLIAQHMIHSSIEITDLFSHCVAALLNIQSFSLSPGEFHAENLSEIFESCRAILDEKSGSDGSLFADSVKPVVKSASKSGFLLSNLVEALPSNQNYPDQSGSAKRLILSTLNSYSVPTLLTNAICNLPLLSQASSSGCNLIIIKNNWPMLLSELQFLSSVINLPRLEWKESSHVTLLQFILEGSPDKIKLVTDRILCILDINIALCNLPRAEAPKFCFSNSYHETLTLRYCFSSWLNFLSQSLTFESTSCISDAIDFALKKLSAFFVASNERNESSTWNSLFNILLFDYTKLICLSVERESSSHQKLTIFASPDTLGHSVAVVMNVFQKLIADPNALFTDDVSRSGEDTYNRRDSHDAAIHDLEASFIDEDNNFIDGRSVAAKKTTKSTSQDDPCTAIINLFALDDQLTVPIDFKSSGKLSNVTLTGILDSIRGCKSSSPEFWIWSLENSPGEFPSPKVHRHVAFTLGADIGGIMRKMSSVIAKSFTKYWQAENFVAISLSLRKLLESPVSRQRASLLNIVKYIFLSLVQQSIVTAGNFKDMFAVNAMGSADFWLANVDAFVRRLTTIFTYHLSSSDSTALSSFVLGLWTEYLTAIAKLNLQNYSRNAIILSVPLANDMLFYFYLLPFTDKRTVVGKICSTFASLVSSSSSFDYPQFAMLLAIANVLVCRFVYEPPENALRERIVCGPMDESCSTVLLSSYSSDNSSKSMASYETLGQDHQIRAPPVLDRLGMASFGASGLQVYNDFYEALLQVSNFERFGGGISVDSVAVKTSSVWNTWLSIWYLLPSMPPPSHVIERLMNVNDLPKTPTLALLFSTMATLNLRENSNYNAWMEDSFTKLYASSSSPNKKTRITEPWVHLRSSFNLENLLNITGAYFSSLALEFKQAFFPFVIESKTPDVLPSLPQVLSIQLLVNNVLQLLKSNTKDFGESSISEMVKSPSFGSFMNGLLKLFEWLLFLVKFSASKILHADDPNDRCLHLRAFLDEYGPNSSSSPSAKSSVFDQLISKAGARSGSAIGTRTSQSRSATGLFSPLSGSVELKSYILNPYFRHLYCVVEMIFELFNATAAISAWQNVLTSNACPVTSETLNAGVEPTLTSSVFESMPYLQNGCASSCSSKLITSLLEDVFGEAWTVAYGEYLLAISHRLLFAISESSGGGAVSLQKSVALKQAALKCISGHLPASKKTALVWQRAYEHCSGESCNLGKLLLSCNEATLQPQAVNVVCQILIAAGKNDFKQELFGVVATLNTLANENSVMFLLMSLLSSTNGSNSSLEELLASLVSASSIIGPKLFVSILDCLLGVSGEALKAGDFNAVSDHIFPAIVLTTRALPNAEGHLKVFSMMPSYLETCRIALVDSEGNDDAPTKALAVLLTYTCRTLSSAMKTVPSDIPRQSDTNSVEDQLSALFSPLGCPSSESKATTPAVVTESSECDEAEEEDDIDNKLCTFTQSHKSFMNQHWYHCHSCSMTDGFGVCSVCAKVCHKDHDLAYSKFSSFFCDCGAKEDNSCIAKTRRISNSNQQQQSSRNLEQATEQASSSQPAITSHFARLTVAARGRPLPPTPNQTQAIDLRNQHCCSVNSKNSVPHFSRLSENSPISDCFTFTSPADAQEVLAALKSKELLIEIEETIGSMCKYLDSNSIKLSKRCVMDLNSLKSTSPAVQIGSSIFGEQSYIELTSDFKFDGHKVYEADKTRLKQLVESGKIRLRLVACNPVGSLSYYAVIQKSNRLDLFGLSHLAQAAASVSDKNVAKPRKYQPHKLGCLSLPFSLAGVEINRENDSILAVYGISDVDIIVLSPSTYTPREQLAIQVQVESQQSFIVGCRWLPGSLSIVAIVLNDCIKIYDTSVDVATPIYHFLLPSCKIVDLAFAVYSKEEQYALILGANGHIYVQKLCSEFGAHAGPFYVTSAVLAPENQKSLPSAWRNAGETLCGGGLSLGYSHRLQLLALTCESGVFVLPNFVPNLQTPADIFANNIICVTPRSDREKWLFSHGEMIDLLVPGLFLGTSDTGCAVALAVKPDAISVAVSEQLNHCGVRCAHYFLAHQGIAASKKICIFGICNDGKLLKIGLEQNQVNHWMSYSTPAVTESGVLFDINISTDPSNRDGSKSSQPQVKRVSSSNKDGPPPVPKRSNSTRPTSYAAAASTAVVKFPVDFFERCQLASNVEFGGAQLLHVYNREQLKMRLSASNNGMYIASNGAFSLSVANKTAGTILVGVRIQLGSHRSDKCPQFIRIFDRTITVNCPQSRWYDCPLTRSEAIAGRNKLQIYFGGSSSGTTIVDSVCVYVKTRDEFGWAEPEIDAPSQLSPSFSSNGNRNGDDSNLDCIQPGIYVTAATQTVLLSGIGILRRLNEGQLNEKLPILLLQTPSTLGVLRASLAWLLANASPSSVRNIVWKAVSTIDISSCDVPSFELMLILYSFLAISAKQQDPNNPEQRVSPELLSKLVARYHKFSTERPLAWSTIPIHQLELSRSLTFSPYLVLLLLEAISRPHSAKMLAGLLSSPHIGESFMSQQALDMFYFSGLNSPWAAVINCSSVSADISAPPQTPSNAEKFHSE